MKYFSIVILISSILLLPITGLAKNKDNNQLPLPKTNQDQKLDSIVAIVNDKIITEKQLKEAIKQTRQQLENQNVTPPSEKDLHKQVLDQLINQTLQLQLAKKMSIQVSDDQLNQALTDIAKRNKLTLVQLRQAVIERGVDYKTYRKQIRQQMIINQLQQRVISPDISVTDQEVDNYLKTYQQQKHTDTEYHVRDILIPLPSAPSSQQLNTAKQEANKIFKKLRQGENFQKLAASNSSGKSALQGGDLGWRTTADLPDVFAKHLLTMDTGDIAGPIRAENGYHIIKLIATRNAKKLSKETIKQKLYQRKFEQQLQNWLQQLRDSAYIKIMAE